MNYDPTALFSNLKRQFSGAGGAVPSTTTPTPTPLAIPKPAPFNMPKPSITPTMGPIPAPVTTPQIPAPVAGPVRPATPVIAPPVAPVTAPVASTTSTGQTINTATGGIVAGATPVVAPPAPTVTAPVVPTVPTAPSAEQSAVTSAEAAYKAAGLMTPEQEAAQAELDKLTESLKAGYTGAGQQAIPMEFITGQQKAIEQRGLNLAEPLTKKLARMEAKRLSGLETSKFALERADKAVANLSATKAAEAKAKEDARQFDVTQAGTAETRALAEKKFNEDKRQFGLEYAQKAATEAAKTAGTKLTTAGAQDLKDKAANIQSLIDDPALNSAVGPNPLARTSFTTAFTGARQNWVGGIKQLTSKETLDTLTNLKAKGGTLGALSDQERVMLQNAATKIGEWEIKDKGVATGFYNVDEASFKKELGTLKMLTERALANAGISTASNVTVAPDGSQVEITD